MSVIAWGIEAVERGLVPDLMTRSAMRRLCGAYLQKPRPADTALFLASLRSGPVASETQRANEQHYEVPAEFFAQVLGPHGKYSCCYWPTETTNLAEAEAAALEITGARAELEDGQDVLELGCGWGALSLWMAERYPQSRFVAISNSHSQRRWIESLAEQRGLNNVRVITSDINVFRPEDHGLSTPHFDRIVSVEMFEHVRNFEELLRRIATWLRPDGKLFVHHFAHRQLAYPFETDKDVDWMGRHFFSGGIMPCADLLQNFPRDLAVEKTWTWNGRHYQRTSDAWLHNLDANRSTIMPILVRCYGPADAARWFQRWRMFFLAVSELFGFAKGQEWLVAHVLLHRQP